MFRQQKEERGKREEEIERKDGVKEEREGGMERAQESKNSIRSKKVEINS